MNCERASELIDRRMDGELEAVEQAALAHHLAGCGGCAELVQRMDRLGRVLDAVAETNDAMLAAGGTVLAAGRTSRQMVSAWRAVGGFAAAACVGMLILISSTFLEVRGPDEQVAAWEDSAFSIRLFGDSEKNLLAARVESGVPGVHLVYLAPIIRSAGSAASQPVSRT